MKSQKNRVHVCRNVRRNEDEERKEERKENVEVEPCITGSKVLVVMGPMVQKMAIVIVM